MKLLARIRIVLVVSLIASACCPFSGAGDVRPQGGSLEEQPRTRGQAKIVLVAGSSVYKPGEHEYVAGCAALGDLLRQSPGVFPTLAIDWPRKPETLQGARAVVLFFDGGDKHGLLEETRIEQIQKLADDGAGLVLLHQVIDVPKDQGDRFRNWTGAAWEKGYSARAHWIADFRNFPDHPIFRGVKPFQVNDGWLTGMRFKSGLEGVTPLLRTVPPKSPTAPRSESDSIVAWAYERPHGGRTFTFTGAHLHESLSDENYRRFLVNSILWSAGQEIPPSGAPVALTPDRLKEYLKTAR